MAILELRGVAPMMRNQALCAFARAAGLAVRLHMECHVRFRLSNPTNRCSRAVHGYRVAPYRVRVVIWMRGFPTVCACVAGGVWRAHATGVLARAHVAIVCCLLRAVVLVAELFWLLAEPGG